MPVGGCCSENRWGSRAKYGPGPTIGFSSLRIAPVRCYAQETEGIQLAKIPSLARLQRGSGERVVWLSKAVAALHQYGAVRQYCLARRLTGIIRVCLRTPDVSATPQRPLW